MRILASNISIITKRLMALKQRLPSLLSTAFLATTLSINTIPQMSHAQSADCAADPVGTMVNAVFEKSGEPAVHLRYLLDYLRNNGAEEGNKAANQIAKELNIVESTLPQIETALSKPGTSSSLRFSSGATENLVALCSGFLKSYALGESTGSDHSSGSSGDDSINCQKYARKCHQGCISTGNNPQCGLIPNASGKAGDPDQCKSNVECSKTVLGCYYGQCILMPDKKGVYRCADKTDCETWKCEDKKCKQVFGGSQPRHQCAIDDDCIGPEHKRLACSQNQCKVTEGIGLDDCGACLFCPPGQKIHWPDTNLRPIPPASCCPQGTKTMPDGSCACPKNKEWVPYPDGVGSSGRCLCKAGLIQVGDLCEECKSPLVPHQNGGSCICPTGEMTKDENGTISCGCPPGTGQIPVPEGCQCPDGSGMKNDKCTTCTDGTTLDPQTNQCTHCDPPRKYSYSTTKCECPWGSIWDGSACNCKKGTAKQPDETCRRCPYPQVAINGKCEVCPTGQRPITSGADDGAGCECDIGTVPNGKGGCVACYSPGVVVDGQCQCPPGHTLIQGYCVKNPCTISGQVRDDKGECSCPSDEEVVGNKCLKKCKPNEIRLQNGSCFQVAPCQPGTVVCYNQVDGSACSGGENIEGEEPECLCEVCKLALS